MFKDLVLKNRSVRGFDRSRQVTTEELREMVDCARLSASSMNVQPLKFHIVSDEHECEVVNSLIKYAAALPELGLPYEGQEASAYILICHDKDIISNDQSMQFMKDVGITAQSITLAATEMGLNCCMIGNYNKDKMREALNLPENITVQLVISIGKSLETIKLVDLSEGDSHNYYRDENGVHYVPKRKLDDILI